MQKKKIPLASSCLGMVVVVLNAQPRMQPSYSTYVLGILLLVYTRQGGLVFKSENESLKGSRHLPNAGLRGITNAHCTDCFKMKYCFS